MASKLGDMLERRNEDIKAAILEAERELEACRQHCRELEATIRQARLAIGVVESAHPPLSDEGRAWMEAHGQAVLNSLTFGRQLYLHEAMELVLQDAPNGVMRAPAIARAINDSQLYRQRDGGSVSVQQIHARVYHYPEMFERTAEGIRLRDAGHRAGVSEDGRPE